MLRMPTMARFRSLMSNSTIVVGGMFLGACANDATAPSPATARTAEGISRFTPSAANLSLYGVADGVYALTVNPTKHETFFMGQNYIDFPANSICSLATSSYGPAYWDSACTPETNPVPVIVTITGASTATPRIDFQPAMRFSPSEQVELFVYDRQALPLHSWTLLYCNALNVCVDESKTDPSQTTYLSRKAKGLFRKIKHFSGYLVSSDAVTPPPGL